MESELELNDILQQMHVIATVPDLYHVLVELNTVRSLLQLLSHENTGMSSEKVGATEHCSLLRLLSYEHTGMSSEKVD